MRSVLQRGQNSGRGPSPNIWYDCPVLQMIEDPGVGIHMYENFIGFGTPATGVPTGNWDPIFEGDCTLAGSPTPGGGLVMFGTTDNEEAAVQFGGAGSAPFIIPANSSDSTAAKLWFECRIKKSAVTDALGAFFIGLAGEGAGVADFMADAGNDFSDVDLLGFWNDPTDDSVSSHVHTVTQKTGAAFDTIVDTFDTLVADTYVKYGFVYDPSNQDFSDTQRIKFYLNGAEQTTYIGEDSGDATVYIGDTTTHSPEVGRNDEGVDP